MKMTPLFCACTSMTFFLELSVTQDLDLARRLKTVSFTRAPREALTTSFFAMLKSNFLRLTATSNSLQNSGKIVQ